MEMNTATTILLAWLAAAFTLGPLALWLCNEDAQEGDEPIYPPERLPFLAGASARAGKGG